MASLQDKWTEASIGAGFIAVPTVFLRQYSRMKPALTDFQFIFLINFVDYFRGRKPVFTGWETLARDLNVDADVIKATIDELVAKGYVEEVLGTGDRGNLIAYDINGLRAKLDELIPPPPPPSKLQKPRHQSPRDD